MRLQYLKQKSLNNIINFQVLADLKKKSKISSPSTPTKNMKMLIIVLSHYSKMMVDRTLAKQKSACHQKLMSQNIRQSSCVGFIQCSFKQKRHKIVSSPVLLSKSFPSMSTCINLLPGNTTI